jgi:glycosyltransferase involved in cell wall biosynthesis
MKTILFLTQKMTMGFGVGLVIEQLSVNLSKQGYRIVVGCLQGDTQYSHFETRVVSPDPESLAFLCSAIDVDYIIAHTTPFFEILPYLAPHYTCIAYEHGDPSPEFFKADGAERKRITEFKQKNVYPYIHGVVAISEFIKSDIKWDRAQVIYNGADHIADELFSDSKHDGQFKVGTLMRLGKGEALYKGNDLFGQIAVEVRRSNPRIQFEVMGRGSEEDKIQFNKKGITVHLNASEKEKSEYLANICVFVTCSLWEGFNLPLVEAMKKGKPGLAFDTGAHPEVTPLVFSSPSDVSEMIIQYYKNESLRILHGDMCRNYVNTNFNWTSASYQFANYLCSL